MTAKAGHARRLPEQRLAASELADAGRPYVAYAETPQKLPGPLHRRVILIDHNDCGARFNAAGKKLLQIPDRPGVTRTDPGDGVVRRWVVGIY
jgi:hypothetical protein